jgi:hypothetical protein
MPTPRTALSPEQSTNFAEPMPSRPALPSPEVRRLGEPPARGPDDARRGSYLREAA